MTEFEPIVDVGPEEAANLIALAAPHLAGSVPRKVGEGWDYQVFEVDGQWIFRFPKNQDAARKLMVERALLPLLSRSLPVPVPRYEFWRTSSGGFPFPFGGYKMLEGTVLEECPPGTTSSDRAVRQLGDAIKCVHGFSVNVVQHLGVKLHSSDPLSGAVERRRLLEDVLPRDLLSRCAAYLSGQLSAPSPAGGEQTLIHGDLGMDHVLVDDGGEVRGIIDWSDLSIGDPAVDFAHVWLWGGESALAAALQAYGRTGTDREFCEHVRFLGRCHALEDAGEKIESGLITGGSIPGRLWRAFEGRSR